MIAIVTEGGEKAVLIQITAAVIREEEITEAEKKALIAIVVDSIGWSYSQ